jgi:hypothetical protein
MDMSLGGRCPRTCFVALDFHFEAGKSKAWVELPETAYLE